MFKKLSERDFLVLRKNFESERQKPSQLGKYFGLLYFYKLLCFF